MEYICSIQLTLPIFNWFLDEYNEKDDILFITSNVTYNLEGIVTGLIILRKTDDSIYEMPI